MFTALLIGNESLTRHCGDMLLARGHAIACVVTRNADVGAWARGLGLRVAAPGAELSGLAVDWLLSVANLAVIPDSVLALASRGAVNFHDGPLPRYAGLNAPVWALWNGEARHGISWHLIGGGVDEGDILEQRLFDIGPQDTALTLNTRCFEAAIDSFPDLVAQLETGALRRVPQDLSQRSLYRRADRPAAFGRLDFTADAKALARQVRALDHGGYWNPLTTAKIAHAGGILNVGAAEVVPGAGVAGAVLSVEADGLVVACATGAVRLSRLTCQARGLPVAGSVVTDAVLPGIKDAGALTQVLASVVGGEPGVRRALTGLQPVVLGGAGAGDWVSVPLAGELPLLALALVRAAGQGVGGVAYSAGPSIAPGYVSDWVPLSVPVSGAVGAAKAALEAAMARAGRGFALDIRSRDVALRGGEVPSVGVSQAGAIAGTCVTLTQGALWVDTGRMPLAEAQALAARVMQIAGALDGAEDLAAVQALDEAEYAVVVQGFNQTAAAFDDTLTVHRAVEAQAARSPDAVALVCDGDALTYAALNARANRAAAVLRQMGVGPGVLVGLCVPRSLDLVVGALAIQKAGGAYVPMDPGYPADRIALFIEDSGCPVIVSVSSVGLPAHVAQVLLLDRDVRIAAASGETVEGGAGPGDLAYMIYTSGSTGRPKGVMVEHRNVINFFAGMDARIGTDPGVWLAVTSLSFDISVLELFWTLSRGFKVVLSGDEQRSLVSSGRAVSAQGIEFSLYYWGNDDGAGPKKYELLLEGAKFADTHGFCAVWTPERHFHAFGGPYPNPAVTGAAVAAVTRNIGVRAGSCVMPLHHPARIAEEWAVIDNLTAGRAGIAVASGWHPDDFVLRPQNTPPANKAAMFEAADQVRRLWRGETVEFPTKDGVFGVVTQPRPVSKELPLWVTTAGNPDTWREAGAIGANVLTHLLGQTVDEVGEKIVLYHQALRDAGHDPARHVVTLMLHTFIGQDRDAVRDLVRGPMKDYLRSAAALIKQYAWAFPAFKKPAGVVKPMDIDIASLDAAEMDAILDFAFQRYFEESGLFGTVDDALARVEALKRIGVGEVACLIDYGVAPDVVLSGLPALAQVVAAANAGVAEDDYAIAAQIVRHGVTHLQCTPSMARMIAMNDDSRAALAGVKTLMLGGEALPGALVSELRGASGARILNMYGPTETTIWSSVEEVGAVEAVTNIGTPLANQQMYVLDDAGAPVARGVAGELWIGGHGVTRGYWQREDLTADRFRPDPFVTPDRAAPWGARMYRTGDLVRWRADGRLDFLGRADHQVKLRGYRIELGEIEAVLEAQPGVRQAVVLAREDTPGDLRLVAYVVGPAAHAALKAALAARLPDHMVPAHLVTLDAMPLTPNRKVDRKALPAPTAAAPQVFVPPVGVEAKIAAIWARVLGVASVGARDNFFALGGHSLLAVQVHREIKQALGTSKLSITDIFRFPVLGQLAAHLEDAPKPAPAVATGLADRADARADAMARRRAMRGGRVDA